ncbi:MAG: hypothetical protein FWG73_06675 [Planctomycetaceae bacterium]|nr:hypothetical protein [Planctomycetaceae bacterium]
MSCEKDELDISVTGTSGSESKNWHDRTAEDWLWWRTNWQRLCYRHI